MKVLGRRVEVNSPKLARAAALEVNKAVVLATPVDEGVARSNWLPSLGRPRFDTIPAHVPGSNGSTGAANIAAQLIEAQVVIASYLGNSSIHITNNLRYIARLNAGYSAQAPANFVEQGISAGVAEVRRNARKILKSNFR